MILYAVGPLLILNIPSLSDNFHCQLHSSNCSFVLNPCLCFSNFALDPACGNWSTLQSSQKRGLQPFRFEWRQCDEMSTSSGCEGLRFVKSKQRLCSFESHVGIGYNNTCFEGVRVLNGVSELRFAVRHEDKDGPLSYLCEEPLLVVWWSSSNIVKHESS